MQVKLTCPQCQSTLVVPDTARPGKSVTCPHCELKFILSEAPAASLATGSGSGRPLMALVLLALGVGAGVGGVLWYQSRNQNPPDSKIVENKPTPEPEAKGLAEVKPQPEQKGPEQAVVNPQPAPMPEAKVPEPEVKVPPPMPEPMPKEVLPEESKPITKKPAPKTYAETKRPMVEEAPVVPPVLVDKPMNPQAPPNRRQKEINEAIEKGIAYLKQAQAPDGTWKKDSDTFGSNVSVGATAIGGLALLECKLAADDPTVQKAANYVRQTQIKEHGHRNYEMSAVILFLDRLGDPRDRPLIQAYALQILAGQKANGGWGYDCPILTTTEMQQLLTFLQATRLPLPEVRDPLQGAQGNKANLEDPLKGAGAKGNQDEPNKQEKKELDQGPGKKASPAPKPAVPAAKSLSPKILSIPLVYQWYFNKPPPQNLPSINPAEALGSGQGFGRPDNSNTQFSLLALWAARRHGVPTERALMAAANRHSRSQNADGGWSYFDNEGGLGAGGPTSRSVPTMTCVGLLGLAMGHASTPVKGGASAKTADNPAIGKGLEKLGEHISIEEMNNFYLLWSVERVGMLYNLKTIGNKEWYDVGVEVVLPLQQQPGNWNARNYLGSTPALDTCFALLFLRRSNLVQDLSERLPLLMSIEDPGRTPRR